MDKRGLEVSFSWMFAIIVGAVILFLAVYAAVALLNTKDFEYDTKVAAELDALLSGFGTKVESGRYSSIELSTNTRVFNTCYEDGIFGEQRLGVSADTGLGSKQGGVESVSKDSYIFSSKTEEGKKLYVFAKTFEMPYKVADILFVYSEPYCFVRAPAEIEEEVTQLGLPLINITQSPSECPKKSIVVCFFDGNCDINVLNDVADKNGERLSYREELIYGTIFADKKIYECQVSRLMKRTGQLALIYAAKASFLSAEGCGGNLQNELLSYSNFVKNKTSGSLDAVYESAQDLRRKNDALNCRLF